MLVSEWWALAGNQRRPDKRRYLHIGHCLYNIAHAADAIDAEL